MDDRILCTIFQYLGNIYDIARCRLVCSQWQQVIDDELELYGILGDNEGYHHEHGQEYVLELNRFVSRHRDCLELIDSIPCHDYILQFTYPQLKSLTMTPNSKSVDIRMLPNAPSLQYLNLSQNHAIWNLNMIPIRYPKLKALVLEGCVFDRAPWICNVLYMIKEKMQDLVIYVGSSSLMVRSVLETMLKHLLETFGEEHIVTSLCTPNPEIFKTFAYHQIGASSGSGDEQAWEILQLLPTLPYAPDFDLDKYIPYTNDFIEFQLVQHVSGDMLKQWDHEFSLDWNRVHPFSNDSLFAMAVRRGDVGVISFLLTFMDNDLLLEELDHLHEYMKEHSALTQHAILLAVQSLRH